MAKSEQFEQTVYANSREEGRERFVRLACEYFGVEETALWVRVFTSRLSPMGDVHAQSKKYEMDCGAMLRPPVKGSPGFF